jgi:hypothetical protein
MKLTANAHLQPKNFKVTWSKFRDDNAAKAHIAAHELEHEIQRTQIAAFAPRELDGDAFRDTLKHQFNLLNMKGGKRFTFVEM